MKRQLVVLLAACSVMGFHSISQAADAAAGKEKSAMCVGCHGPAGVSMNPEWPNLAGQKDKYVINQLKAFRGGERKNPLMTPIAAALSDQDIENLAAYYSGLK
ncbi:MAG: cytochrome c [Gammaproteobacteria bacterium]|nr:cytochrome c [Gammaproteobacteria bacterium]MDH5594601.1 cytochrome c [Gammaproteobacteria bacterium]MDH5613552.1 cytochrome c [Gammaproteobacteria bacterium]